MEKTRIIKRTTRADGTIEELPMELNATIENSIVIFDKDFSFAVKSANGKVWRLVVSDTGVPSTSEIV